MVNPPIAHLIRSPQYVFDPEKFDDGTYDDNLFANFDQ